MNECLDNELSRGASNSVPREHPKLESSDKVKVVDVGRDRKASAVDFGPQKVTKVKKAPAVAEHPNREDVDVNAPTEKRVDAAVALPTMRRKIRHAPKGAHGVRKKGAMQLLVDVEDRYSSCHSSYIFLTMLIATCMHACNA